MNEELVSVIIPAYNAAPYIRQAVESVLAQTYLNYEIVVVDDGSTDSTSQILREYGSAIRYLYQDNHGLSSARNTAIKNARGTVIAPLDSDDQWYPNYLQVMVGFLNQTSQIAGVYCGFQYIDKYDCVVGVPSLKIVPPDKFHETLILDGNWLAPSGVVFLKKFSDEIGLFDETISPVADTDYWYRLSVLYPFVGIPKALVKYRRHDSNMSKDPERMISSSYKLKEKILGNANDDPSSWSETKTKAFKNHYQFAAMGYLAVGNFQKSANCLQRLAGISQDFICRMEVWRGLIRARIPDEYQFDALYRINWDMAETDVKNLLIELDQFTSNTKILPSYHKIKGWAFLALADEMGRARELFRAYCWLWRAACSYPRLFLARPFWGTVARSFRL